MKDKKISFMAGNAIMIALCIVLTLISNYIPIGSLTINLAIIAIALAAILYGPLSGLIVGLVNGCVVMFAASAFFAISPIGTVIVCLLKSSIAGVVCGLIYKALRNKNKVVASIIATLVVPIINTGLFIVGSLIFFNGAFGELISIFVTLNFIIEFAVCLLVTPSINFIIETVDNRNRV